MKNEYPSTAVNTCLLVLLALCFLSIVITVICALKAKFIFKSPKRVFTEGESIPVTLDCKKFFFIPSFKVVACKTYLQRLSSEGKQRYKISSDDKSQLLIEDILPGNLVFKISKVLCVGFFGVFRVVLKRRDLSYEYLVYPKAVEFDISKLQKIVLTGDGEIVNQRGDDYSEPYDIREYVEGDDLKYMHRALTAKYGEYMIKVGSLSKREIYIYKIVPTENFDDMCRQLGQVVYMYETIVEKKSLYYCINDGKQWHLIINRGQLDDLINSKYKEYII